MCWQGVLMLLHLAPEGVEGSRLLPSWIERVQRTHRLVTGSGSC